MSYVSIHNHTHYSNLRLLDCIIKPTDLIDRAFELGLSGVAITDHESLSAHVEAIQYWNKTDKTVKLILGNEIYLTEERKMGIKYPHFIVLAKNAEGHKALRELSSTAWKGSYFDRGMERVPVTKEELHRVCKKYPNTLMATSACIGGELPQYILKLHAAEQTGNEFEIETYKKKVIEFIDFLKECFDQDFYLEIAPNTSEEQRVVNRRIKSISDIFKIPMLFATDSHYLKKEDRFVHKAYLNSKDGEREVDDFYASSYMMGEEEVWEYLSLDFTREEFDRMIQNSKHLADQIESYDLFAPQEIPTTTDLHFVLNQGVSVIQVLQFQNLKKMYQSPDDQDRAWIIKCLNKMYERNLLNSEYLGRLDLEAKELLEISEKLGICMTSYYNTMSKIIEIIWDKGDSIVGVARGSATGFLSCYLLDITQLDPIKWNLPHWRHLTGTRPELPDIDFDTQALRRGQILQAIKDFFGEDNVLNICTFGTEGPKSAILTACRGLGIESDIGLYLTGMIPQDRGFVWPLSDCLYGNEEKGRRAISALKQEVEKHPGLENIILSIEGLVNKRSIHAAGVYIFNKPFIENNALMKAPNGQYVTQWDMNDSDYMGCLKYDFLTVEALDKLRAALDLLEQDGFIEFQGTLKKTYDKYIHPDVLDYSPETWAAACEGEVINLFQFDTLVGGQAIKKVKPQNLLEAASANSLMRLMPLEDGTVLVDKFIEFKNDISLWYSEMTKKGLTEVEMQLLEPHYLPVYGVPNTQEDMMEILMNPHLVGFSLEEANYARKVVGKKKMEDIPKLKKMIYTKSPARRELLDYIYKTAIEPQLGYSFSRNHTVPYTTIALQQLNLFNKYPSIYWNTACLFVNAGAAEDKTTDYAKIAVAIGYMKSHGIKVSLPDINLSKFNFSPNLEKDEILCGLKSITNIGDDVVNLIIANRPYQSMEDFLQKTSINKSAVVSLIKSGAFDWTEKKDRSAIMKDYLAKNISPKSRISLQTVPALLSNGLIVTEEIKREVSIFEFNRYLKSHKNKDYYMLDHRALQFYNMNFNADLVEVFEDSEAIKCKVWDSIYNREVEGLRTWLSKNSDRIKEQLFLSELNEELTKYAEGNLASWEMDSVSFYHSFHELDEINNEKYNIRNFEELPEDPEVEQVIKFGRKQVPIFKTCVIAGTVLGKDKMKSVISVLTPTGVVYIKLRPDQFAEYDKQISERKTDGTKSILDRSWFNRGKKLLITGFRRGSEFVPKKYSHTSTEMLYLIDSIQSDGNLTLKRDRV